MAKKNRGWIKLFRDLTESDIWKDKEPFDCRSAWVDLLLMVNHEERTLVLKNGTEIVIQPGQCLTSTIRLAQRWKWSRSKVNRFLIQLNGQGMTTTNGTTNGTVITVVNWDFFQNERTAIRTTNRTTNRTADRTTERTRTKMYKNKNESNKNVINKKEPSPVPVSGSGGRVYED